MDWIRESKYGHSHPTPVHQENPSKPGWVQWLLVFERAFALSNHVGNAYLIYRDLTMLLLSNCRQLEHAPELLEWLMCRGGGPFGCWAAVAEGEVTMLERTTLRPSLASKCHGSVYLSQF